MLLLERKARIRRYQSSQDIHSAQASRFQVELTRLPPYQYKRSLGPQVGCLRLPSPCCCNIELGRKQACTQLSQCFLFPGRQPASRPPGQVVNLSSTVKKKMSRLGRAHRQGPLRSGQPTSPQDSHFSDMKTSARLRVMGRGKERQCPVHSVSHFNHIY